MAYLDVDDEALALMAGMKVAQLLIDKIDIPSQ
jgi:hypothetical protein